MKLSTLFVAALAVAVLAAAKEDWKKPDFCGTYDCPPFSVDSSEQKENYEVRTYEAGRWALTNVTDTKYELAYTKASAKLLKYFNGANDAEERLERTTPTLAALLLSKDSRASERNYSFSMWLPTTYQNEARDEVPQPNDEEVQIMDYPETTVYVRTFGGFATEATALQEITTLHEELTKDEQEFEEDVVFVAVYDSAVKLLNRHNEVHVMKKGEAPSTAQVS